MPVRNTGGYCRAKARQDAVPELPAIPAAREPVMRRWPHAAAEKCPPEAAEAELYAIGCALARQTRLLTEIRALLERLAERTPSSE